MARIAIDARSVTSQGSGIASYVEALLRHAVPLASDLDWLVLRHPSARVPIVSSDRVHELVYPSETKSMRTVFAMGRAFRGFGGYDLYHSPADIVPLGMLCPSVVTIHDLMWVEAPRLASAFAPVRVANGLWYTVNIRRAVRDASAVIAISHATADALRRLYPAQAHKIAVVHHGIDHERFSPQRAPPRSALDGLLPADTPYSLIVGQGSPYKNHAAMVRAFVAAVAQNRQHKLVIVRRFSRIDFEMNSLLRRPEVQRRVLVVPHVADATLRALYRHARMLLCASHYEGFGMPALEAMCLGTPVLASTAPAVVEVTGDAALHADPTSHTDLVDKIRELDENEGLRAELAEAGLRRARQFSWTRCAKLTLDVYRAVLCR